MCQQWLVYSVGKIQCLTCSPRQTNTSLTGTSVSLYTCVYTYQQWLVYSVDKIQCLTCRPTQTNASLTGTSVSLYTNKQSHKPSVTLARSFLSALRAGMRSKRYKVQIERTTISSSGLSSSASILRLSKSILLGGTKKLLPNEVR